MRTELILWRSDLTNFFYLRVGEDGVVYDLIDVGSGLILFILFFTMTNHLPDFSVRYIGSRPITDGKASKCSLSLGFMVSGLILRMGTMLVLSQESIMLSDLVLDGCGICVCSRPYDMKGM